MADAELAKKLGKQYEYYAKLRANGDGQQSPLT